jgi:Holliday junction resolvase-like predicted endonuclease
VDHRALPLRYLLAAGALLLLFALVQSFRLWWRVASRRRALASARERGAAGEVRAEALLRRLGFRVLGRQVGTSYGVGVDGARVAVDLRADYLVAHGGRRYVAEVKTGRLAPRIDTAATRRQLLEYRVAFDVDGVLLVDAEADRVHTVDFPLPLTSRAPARPASRIGWLVAGAALGAIATAFLRGGW